ncbi:MAG TPA: iron-containing alcohol dehydrogenase [Noviherbaspirillum sp.]|uniref:iron-containing alcohol dehydrogenase n=1 Tax=Noviherbaspirillum sp. TaxID=1926288 RepID=UPI002B462067|nr:iron-containing alcohol dehydrogenase [Noviherbaspirillum sp.]HJV84390.1 iron-containing alcohol dehydrogenase [Noviherbaspirillum sp.]
MIAIPPFSVARLPEIRFGAGRLKELAEVTAQYGRKALLVTGGRSFVSTLHWQEVQAALQAKGIAWECLQVTQEPSPDLVDQAVAKFLRSGIEVVIGIGGGSVLDAAKAIAGLLPAGHSVMNYLEGVGHGLAYEGPALPFIAVPTTAGTGSEATKNAVLSLQGDTGFKKSFRHDVLVPRVAIVDPELLVSCPKDLIAANGMDAFTQLLESYVSSNASPFTDALARSGLEAFRDGFWKAWDGDPAHRMEGLSSVAYAALLSGITLAQAGLGSVHGLASPLGAFFPIPHGVVCGTLVAQATEVNIRALRERDPHARTLKKYAEVGRLLSGMQHSDDIAAADTLVRMLHAWTERLQLPRLSAFGMGAEHVDKVVENCRGGSMRTNPIVLTYEELAQLLLARL